MRTDVSEPLVAAGDAVSAWASSVLVAWGPSADALYVATSEAGAAESLAFWAAARATGFALAAPGAFPYTLANAPAGRIGTALGIRGPSVTVLGTFDDALAAASDDLADGLCTRALVVHLDPVAPATTTTPDPTLWRLVHTVLAADSPPAGAPIGRALAPALDT
ncbi:beta-ketoacyl-[acyl-carrier-protein] synthase family protein [Cellulomonas rhizosphaerae]|uniref:Beta-ketoacyl synthase N-terminal domain-containing protein n=1 Tax=Cellulomonas rhizosphaerae TaxID=2293719 RepID=A0A413RNQ5_9CELL|nr:hypothetical protein [Cellulomonas rhizosphaerae]RHA43541.1 hypothetical protein D1825_05790 [Cellulomonas rhizosphaerae]